MAADRRVIHLLVAGSHPELGDGWTVESWRGPRREGVLHLAARGAAPAAGPRVAQAVAVRVLTEEGVAVRHWCACGAEYGPMFLACPTEHRVPGDTSSPAAARARRRTRFRVRRRRAARAAS